MQLFWDILAAIGFVAVGSGAIVGLAFWLFKLFGEKWLSAKFAERLAKFQHEQAKELERLRYQINTLFDRKAKLQTKEFEVVLECWAKLVDAFHLVAAAISSLQTYPDFNRISDEELDEFLADTKLTNWQKAELKRTEDRLSYFIKASVGIRISNCREACREYFVYSKKNSIFLPADFKANMDEIHTLTWEALMEYKFNEDDRSTPRERQAGRSFDKKGPELLSALEDKIRDRLRDDHVA